MVTLLAFLEFYVLINCSTANLRVAAASSIIVLPLKTCEYLKYAVTAFKDSLRWRRNEGGLTLNGNSGIAKQNFTAFASLHDTVSLHGIVLCDIYRTTSALCKMVRDISCSTVGLKATHNFFLTWMR